MQFNYVDIYNFMSYQNDSVSFEGRGLTLIEGRNEDEGDSNGAGKSTVWDAISWALFGSTVRGLKNDDVINRKIGRECYVCLGVEYGGTKFTIHRYRKHKEFGNRLIVKSDGKDIEHGTLAMTQNWMNDKFGLDFDLFRCTVIFAQGETFNFVDAGNKKQKEILSKIMRVDFDKLQDETKEKRRVLESGVDDKDKKILVLESHLEDDIEEKYKEQIETWEKGKSKDLQDLEFEIGEVEHSISTTSIKDESKLNELQSKIKEKLEAMETVWRKISSKSREAVARYKVCNEQLAEMDDAIKDGKCGSCGQDTKNEFMKERRHNFANMMMGHTLIEEGCKDQMQRLEFKMDDLASSRDSLDKVISTNRTNICNLGMFERNLKGAKERKDKLIKERNPFEQLMSSEAERQEQIKDKLVELKGEVSKLRDQLIYINFWVNAFGDAGIKSFVFDLIASSLSEKSNKYANILTNGQVSVKFDTQSVLKSGATREKFDCAVISEGKKVKYESYSGGEKRRISLAVDVALSEIMSEYYGSSFNIMVLDEQDSYLDRQGRESYLALLKELSKERKVYVVSHDSEFKSKFDDVMTVVKSGGVSKIE